VKVEDSISSNKRGGGREGSLAAQIKRRGKRPGTAAKRIMSESATAADSAFVPYEIW
jgi:hypothetical protein